MAPAGAAATASGNVHARFLTAQKQLETRLALRTTRLANLQSDIGAAKSLTAVHAVLLTTRVTAEQGEIAALVAKVPTDTTYAELNADRSAMVKDNRVFAVMSPQVFETIGGDAVLGEESILASQQSTLLTEVNSLVGEPGYANALNHYNNFVHRTSGVSTNVVRVEANELNQTPQGYPGNTHVFVTANKAILQANISLAYASYDASVIGLATGGYAGS
jgi:hypothetical protein